MTAIPSSRLSAASSLVKARALVAFLATVLAMGFVFAPGTTHATSKKQPASTTANKPGMKKGTVKIRPQAIRSDSQESTADRDRRLYRECKGLPNAGACLGYARGK